MDTKKQITIGLGLVILGGGIGYFAKPTKVETRTVEVIKTETKIQKGETKIVYKTKIVKPDGTTIETESDRTDTHENTDIASESSKLAEKVIVNHVGLTVQALAVAPFNELSKPEIGAYVSKRVFGNVVFGIGATKERALVTAGVEF